MKLFVSDIDGTLYWYNNQNNNKISDTCRIAIKRWLDEGNIFALATARVHLVRNEIMDDLGFNVDYLGGNGAEIIEANGNEIFSSIPISYFFEAINYLKKNNYDASIKICVNHQFITPYKDKYPFYEPSRIRRNLLRSKLINEVNLDENAVGVNMSILSSPHLTKKIENELKEIYVNRLNIVANDIDNIDFIPLNAGKAQSILYLAEKYDIDRNDIIVIGDAENDISMFEITENSYCMSHSSPSIIKKANKVVDLVEDAINEELRKDKNYGY